MATVVLERVNDQWKFIVSAIAGIIGFIITLIFVPGMALLALPASLCLNICFHELLLIQSYLWD